MQQSPVLSRRAKILLLLIKVQVLTTYYLPIDARMIRLVTFIGHRSHQQQQQQHLRSCNRIGSSLLYHFTTCGKMSSSTTTTTTTTSISNSNTAASNADESSTTTKSTTSIRILGLHGSGGNGQQFEQLLNEWKDYFTSPTTTALSSSYNYEISTISGPVPSKDNNDGYQWWEMPPPVRSFNAESYEYFESSRHLVDDAITTTQPNLIIGHSQGAILLTALLALQVLQNHPNQPSIGYILNGVAWPNPYTEQFESLKDISTPTTSNKIRILIIVGIKDRINPPEQAYRVAEAFKDAGYSVTVLHHPGGHSLPLSSTLLLSLSSSSSDTATTPVLDTIYQWIIE